MLNLILLAGKSSKFKYDINHTNYIFVYIGYFYEVFEAN